MARTLGATDEGGPTVRGYLPVAAFTLCSACLLAMVPVTFVALSGGEGRLAPAVPALAVAMAVAVLALVTSDR